MAKVDGLDGLCNIQDRHILCLTQALDFYAKKNLANVAISKNWSKSDMLQAVAQPLHNISNEYKRSFAFSIPTQKAKTKKGKDSSPAIATYTVTMGLSLDEKNDFALTKIGQCILNHDLSIPSYALMLLSKVGIYDVNNERVSNLLTQFCKYAKDNPNASYTKDDIKSKVLTGIGPETYFDSREDIAFNAFLVSGFLSVSNDEKYIVHSDDYNLISFIAINGDNITPPNDEEESYMGDINKGIFELISKDSQYLFYPKYKDLINIKFGKSNTSLNKHNNISYGTLQTIFYGAPGTGKSYKTNEIVRNFPDTIRTTFHPDSDYASFVGCYKPVEETVDARVVPVVIGATGVTFEQNNGTYKEKRITYRYTKQAFLKAYILAWKKMSKINHPSLYSVSFHASGKSFTIKSVQENQVILKSIREITQKDIERRWSARLSSGTFQWPGDNTGSDTQVDSICKWLSENLFMGVSELPNDWWQSWLSKLAENLEITGKKADTIYIIYKEGERIFLSNETSAKSETLKEYYNDSSKTGYDAYAKIAEILRGINSDDFDTAWKELSNKISKPNSTTSQVEFAPQYLVIEEINRGNCAQIFGDIFQLLDRGEEGFSTYPITPDDDIRKELNNALGSLDLSSVECYINNIFSKNYPDGIVGKIKSGELLVLPCNLYLLATMNTSDQSLFPMDSAFKRRWDWEFVPIRYSAAEAIDANDKFHTFTITIGKDAAKKTYLWTEFLEKVNDKIRNITDSEDKQMGEYFIKKSIEEKDFINKVMFYLWSEVGKDFYNTTNAFFKLPKDFKDKDGNDKKEFSFNELFKGNAIALLEGFMAMLEVKRKR